MPGIASLGIRLLDEAVALLFQPLCWVCGELAVEAGLCLECQPIHPIDGMLCDRCGVPRTQKMTACGECEARRPVVTRARSLLWLEEDTKKLVHPIKFGGRFELLDFFLPVFLDRFDPFFPPDSVIVPVPLHSSRFLERGFNQAEILGRWVARLLQLEMISGRLRKVQATAEQKGLSAVERAKNLRRSLEWRGPESPPANVLLIDDVWTTGLTAEACARVLRRAGCENVYAWTLFRTPKLL